MSRIENFALRIRDIEQRVRPIADRPMDITKPGWGAQLMHAPHPLDEAGIRSEAETLLDEVIGFYDSCGEQDREAIRALFVEYRAFTWAASLPFAPADEKKLRQHLLLFSIRDQGRDSRDALLLLQELCRDAGKAGVNRGPVLREIAELSSDRNKYGMGSTKDMLLRASKAETFMNPQANHGYARFEQLISRLRAEGFDDTAAGLDCLLHKVAWTTGAELLGELGKELLAFQKKQPNVTGELRQLLDSCVGDVKRIWPD